MPEDRKNMKTPSYASKSPFSSLKSGFSVNTPSAVKTQSSGILEQLSGLPRFEENPIMKMAEQSVDDPFLSYAKQTMNWEGRRNKDGYIDFYRLPSGDGGGLVEYAGINDRYHPEAVKALQSIKDPSEREAYARKYIADYVKPFASKLPLEMQGFGADLAFNRGAGGATKYIQQGLRDLGVDVKVDGVYGSKTDEAVKSVNPLDLMRASSEAQRRDEFIKAQANPQRAKFYAGLENRIRSRLKTYGG